MTKSSLPSPLKSAVATVDLGFCVLIFLTAVPKLPVPSPKSIEIVEMLLPAKGTVAKSNLPSPLKSPAAIEL